MDDFIPAIVKKQQQALVEQTETPHVAAFESFAVAADRLTKALEARQDAGSDKVAVSNLGSLETRLDAVLRAIRAIQVKPVVDVQVPEPRVTVDAPAIDMKPIEDAIRKLEAPKTEQVNQFIPQKFDEYKLEYFDEDDDLPVATHYYLDGKKVASVHYTYNRESNLTGVRRA